MAKTTLEVLLKQLPVVESVSDDILLDWQTKVIFQQEAFYQDYCAILEHKLMLQEIRV